MRFYINFLLVFSMLVHGCGAHSALNNPPTAAEKQFLGWKNELSNPGFESGLTGWTVTTTLATATTATTEIFEGTRAAEWNPAGVESLRSPGWTPATNAGGNAVAFCKVRSNADADYDVEIYDGANVISEVDVPASTTFINIPVNFVAVGGTTYKVQVTSAGNDDEIQVDSCGIGYAQGYNLGGNYNTATYAGGIKNVGASSCVYSETTSSGLSTFVDLGTGSSCAAWTVVSNGPGTISAQATNDHRFVWTNMPPGEYDFKLGGSFGRSNVGTCNWRLSDGTNNYESRGISSNGSVTLYAPHLDFHVTITEAQGTATRTFKLQAADDAAITCSWHNSADFMASWNVYYFPRTAKQEFTTDQSDYGPTPCTVTGTWNTNTTYTCLESRTGDMANYEIHLALSGAPTSTTLTVNLPSGRVIDTTKLLVTTNNVLPNSDLDFMDAGNSPYTGKVLYESTTSVRPVSLTTNTTSGVLASITQVSPYTSGTGDFLNIKFSVPIVGWVKTNRAPQLVNSIVSWFAGVLGIVVAKLNCDGSGSIVSQLGSQVTLVGNISGGACAVTLAAGYSAAPYCFPVPATSGGFSTGLELNVDATSATAVSVDCEDDASTACTAFDFNLFCIGAR